VLPLRIVVLASTVTCRVNLCLSGFGDGEQYRHCFGKAAAL
jgi:hypothetical protein